MEIFIAQLLVPSTIKKTLSIDPWLMVAQTSPHRTFNRRHRNWRTRDLITPNRIGCNQTLNVHTANNNSYTLLLFYAIRLSR